MPGNFFDLDRELPGWMKRPQCHHPEHNAPSGIYIPDGKGYRHVCPACGRTDIVIPDQPSMNVGATHA